MKIAKWVFKLLPVLVGYYVMCKIYRFRKGKMSEVKLYRRLRKYILRVVGVLGIEYVVEGEENIPLEDSFLLTPNHASLVDPLTFFVLSRDPVGFACKKSIKHYPLVKDFIYLIDGVYLDRGNLKQEIRVMKDIQEVMLDRHIGYIVFPEGTRTKSPELTMNEFKPGAFKFTMKIDKCVVPVCIYGSHRVFDKKIKDRKYPIYVSFLPPVRSEDYASMSTNELSRKVQEAIEARLERYKKEICF